MVPGPQECITGSIDRGRSELAEHPGGAPRRRSCEGREGFEWLGVEKKVNLFIIYLYLHYRYINVEIEMCVDMCVYAMCMML